MAGKRWQPVAANQHGTNINKKVSVGHRNWPTGLRSIALLFDFRRTMCVGIIAIKVYGMRKTLIVPMLLYGIAKPTTSKKGQTCSVDSIIPRNGEAVLRGLAFPSWSLETRKLGGFYVGCSESCGQ